MRQWKDIWSSWNLAGQIGKYGVQPGYISDIIEEEPVPTKLTAVLEVVLANKPSLVATSTDLGDDPVAGACDAWEEFMDWYDNGTSASYTFRFAAANDTTCCVAMVRRVDIVSYSIDLQELPFND